MFGFGKSFWFFFGNVLYHRVPATACLQEQPKQPEPHKAGACCHASSAGHLFLFPPVLQNKQNQRFPFPKQSKTNCSCCLFVNEVGDCSAENVWREEEGLDPQFTQ